MTNDTIILGVRPAAEQLELKPQTSEPQLGHDSHDDVLWLENLLDGGRCWMTASDIKLTSGGRRSDREIREIASSSSWIISGQKGYKHLQHSTPEEIHHATSWLESQAKKMGERAGRIRANAHKLFGKN